MTGIIGVELVGGIMAIYDVLVDEGIEAAGGIEVDDRHGPDVGRLFHALHIGIHPLAYLVGIGLVAMLMRPR